MPDKYVIGLTGNIATGNSLVLRMLKELGADTLDADALVHVLMRRGSPLYDRIVAEFGRYVLDEDLEIDRAKLGNIVFSEPQALAHLESLTHPTHKREAERTSPRCPSSGSVCATTPELPLPCPIARQGRDQHPDDQHLGDQGFMRDRRPLYSQGG